MGKIHILDEAVAVRIAAGEVVERPASIIKELVENSIDALATAISINVVDGGIKYIRITDNGTGIEKDDLALAIQKHATSKISSINDLSCIYSMGFRGEALSSIAAVSMLKISSRAKNKELGAEICVKGGKTEYLKDVGIPEGTTVTVENIFYNIPARYKFLKKPTTEAAYITDIVGRLVIANPGISIKYTSNGNTLIHSPGTGNLQDAILSVYGYQIKSALLEVNYKIGNMSVVGFISKPEFIYKSTKAQSTFINGRYIKSALIQKAVQTAYGERILKGNFPFFVLCLEIPFANVDVNVHPNKLQVNFSDEQSVEYLVINAVLNALKSAYSPLITISDNPAPKINEEADDKTKKEYIRPTYPVFEPKVVKQYPDYSIDKSETFEISEKTETIEKKEIPFISDIEYDYRKIGVLFNTYILVEYKDILYIIDQHAAHERLVYEQVKKRISENDFPVQPLLIPETVVISHEDSLLLKENYDQIKDIGFELEVICDIKCRVYSIPVVFGKPEKIPLIIDDLIASLRENAHNIQLKKSALMQFACKHAVKAGYILSDIEIDAIIHELITGGVIPNCPHGRPIAIAMDKSGIEKNFKRKI